MHFIYSNKRYPQPSKDVSLSPAWSYIQRVTCIALTLFDFWKTARTFLTLCLLNGYSSLEWATESVKRGSRSITSIIPHSHHPPPAPPCLSCLSPSPFSSPPACPLLVLPLFSYSLVTMFLILLIFHHGVFLIFPCPAHPKPAFRLLELLSCHYLPNFLW